MKIEVIENALYVPPTQAEGERLRSGVFDANGRFVAISAMIQSNGRVSHPPEPQDAKAALGGTHLYAGIGRAHFGHFLLEGVTRHWALAQHEVDSVIYAPMPGTKMRFGSGPLSELHELLSGGAPASVLTTPTRIARLIVPEQGIGHSDLLVGTPEFNGYAQPRLQALGAEGPARLYISRSALRARKARMDQEDLIERRLERAGYAIFHPQQHSFAAQCRAYRAATHIVGPDGSPFHLVAMVAQAETKVGIILRRNRPEMLERLSRQISAIAGSTPTCINAVLPMRAQRKLIGDDPKAPTPLDLDKIFAELEAAGFL
ncbi:MAG: glycosyltransferase family 61 protein [Pseudomonadota bacterium]